MKLQAPKGTRDFYPADMTVRNWLMDRWRDVSRRNGFVEYDGPIFEDLELYRVKSGNEIVSQLFHFADRGGRSFAIRPEMTPTLARMVAARANALPRPIKWFSLPRLCRAERPQRGRLREFFQWNIDIVGEESEIADAECIFVAADFFRSVALTPAHVQIKINSRAIVSALLHAADIGDEQLPPVFAALDKRDKMEPAAFAETLAALGLSQRQQQILLEMGAAKGPEGLAQCEAMLTKDRAGMVHCRSLRRVFELLEAMGVAAYCAYDMGVVRGLAYYTGTVFEAFGTGGLRRAICGGGRYDQLVSILGGPPLGGVGFATSDVVLHDLLAESDLLPRDCAEGGIFVIDADASVFAGVLEVVGRIRARGIRADFSYKRQAIGKQFKQATAQGVARAVIVEPDFPQTHRVSVKDMTTGKQAGMTLDEFLADPFANITAAP